LVLFVEDNGLCAEGGKALAAGLKGNQGITELNISNNSLGKNSDYGDDSSGVIALADVIKDMGALSVLSLKSNRLATKEGGKALAQALANNSTLKELDVSSNVWEVRGKLKGDGPGFAQELAIGIKDNRALSVLSLMDNRLATKEVGKALAEALASNSTLKELDVSSNVWKDGTFGWMGDGPGFAQELAVGIKEWPVRLTKNGLLTKENGALSSLFLSNNGLLTKEAGKALGDMLRDNTVLKVLDVSGGGYGMSHWDKDAPGFAQELAIGIKDNGAMSTFTFSGYSSDEPVTMETSMTEADLSGKGLGSSGAIMLSAFLPKCT
jgi:Leucine-rich repeat (LRR) protein